MCMPCGLRLWVATLVVFHKERPANQGELAAYCYSKARGHAVLGLHLGKAMLVHVPGNAAAALLCIPAVELIHVQAVCPAMACKEGQQDPLADGKGIIRS